MNLYNVQRTRTLYSPCGFLKLLLKKKHIKFKLVHELWIIRSETNKPTKIYRNITTPSPHNTLYTSVCVRAMLSAKKGQQKVNFERIRECFVGISMLITVV